MASPSPRSSRGLIIILLVLLVAVGIAFWAMRETLNTGGSSAARTGSDSGATSFPAPVGSAPPGGAVGEYHGRVEDLPGGQPDGQTGGQGDAAPASPQDSGTDTPPQGTRPGTDEAALPSATPSSSPELFGDIPGADQPAPGTPSGKSQPDTGEADGNDARAPRTDVPILDVPAPRVQTPEEAFDDPAPSAASGDTASRRSVSFFDDSARFLVANYWPKGTHPSANQRGISTAGLKTANMRYGTDAPGIQIEGQAPLRGAAALARFFTPSMLDTLYATHADDFIAAMHSAADARRVGQGRNRRALTGAERSEMFSIYASRAQALAAILNAYVDNSESRTLVDNLNYAESAVYAANRDYLESTAEYEIALEEKLPGVTEAKALMDQDAAVYQERIHAREDARKALANTLGTTLDEDTRIYAATWAYRRGPEGAPALREGAKILFNLAEKLDAAAK